MLLTNITPQNANGALVQLVRIHACHAWGHGFESRTHRKQILNQSFGSVAQLNRASDYGSEGYRFESCRSHEGFRNRIAEPFFYIPCLRTWKIPMERENSRAALQILFSGRWVKR